ncbi:MAG: type 1 glutamine amidotransferase, partial [Candidatus Aenigmarchaeota archaeon]|nr:type 1 glutamine amidotransferase [Candidatus Aenigmarchaeota archaeon]
MKFLVFQHVPHEHPGLITHYAAERSIEMDIVKLW